MTRAASGRQHKLGKFNRGFSAASQRRRRSRAIFALVGGALTVLLAVDPLGLSPLVPQLSADEPGSALLSRSERLDEIVDGLGVENPVATQELTGSWDTDDDLNDIPVLPAELPDEDEQVVTLSEETGDDEDPGLQRRTEPAPAQIELGGIDMVVGPDSLGTTPDALRVRVAGEAETEATGITGVLIEITNASEEAVSADAEADISVSYESFAGLVGGDWASRLQLVWLPECESQDDCAPVPLDTINDPELQTVSATVPVTELPDVAGRASGATSSAGGALAVTAGPSGPGGNWGATSLSSSATWSGGGSTGGFSWGLPITLPAVAAGPTPELSISYSSSGSDGKVPSANSQSGQLGEGFDLTTGYVERTYVPCSDDEEDGANNKDRTSGDLCWGDRNATLVFNGSAVELVKQGSTWKAKNDDGSRIEKLSTSWNDGHNNEAWKVTTTDGVQYFFGRNKKSTNGTELNSAWTVPVYGNHEGEDCYHAKSDGGFAASRCQQVWRWNLEYVVDPKGNTMTYFYKKETNRYAYDPSHNDTATATIDTVSYVSGGRLDRIEYGTWAENTSNAPAKVEFTTLPRCITNINAPSSFCDENQADTAENKWPDTPTDQVCKLLEEEDEDDAEKQCMNFSPTFFDRYRLAAISTFAKDGTTFRKIDSWTIGQRFVGQGPAVTLGQAFGAMLVVTSITHTGHKGTATEADDLSLPPNKFSYKYLDNRVDSAGDGYPAIVRPRVGNVRTESGASINLTYRTECTPSTKPGTSEAAQEANN
jgi:hypothetical protein